jgi:hypothetical protein
LKHQLLLYLFQFIFLLTEHLTKLTKGLNAWKLLFLSNHRPRPGPEADIVCIGAGGAENIAFGGGGARLTPIFFYSAVAAGAAAPIGLNENKPKILSVHGTICTLHIQYVHFSYFQRLETPNYSSK